MTSKLRTASWVLLPGPGYGTRAPLEVLGIVLLALLLDVRRLTTAR